MTVAAPFVIIPVGAFVSMGIFYRWRPLPLVFFVDGTPLANFSDGMSYGNTAQLVVRTPEQ